MRTSDPDFTDGTEVTGKEQDRVRAMIGQQRGGGKGEEKSKTRKYFMEERREHENKTYERRASQGVGVWGVE